MHKFDPRKRDFLDDPKTLFFENPDLILSEASVRPGQVAADIGCGTGFFYDPSCKMCWEDRKGVCPRYLSHDDQRIEEENITVSLR